MTYPINDNLLITSTNETVAMFRNPNYNVSILLKSNSGDKAYVRFKNQTGINAWMVGMDDDEQFKIAYGTDWEITDPIVKLRIDRSG